MKNILFILTFFICIQNIYANGFNDWLYETDNGTQIADSGGGPILWNDNQPLNLMRWYFYNDHIIGEYDTFINPEYKTAYFILNELNGELKTFTSKGLLEKHIQSDHLEPMLWTRWYYDHYTFIQFIFIIFIFAPYVAAGIGIFISLLIYLSIILKNKILKTGCIILTSMFLLPSLLFILNDYFTGSI